MDLLECVRCDRRFYLPGGAAPAICTCPQCGSALSLSLRDISVIPLDARWLGPELAPATDPEVTMVSLRRRGRHGGRADRRILKALGDYFAISANGRSVEVTVNRGEPADAPLRVAAVLDGVDAGWEKHFHLPTRDYQTNTDSDASQMRTPPPSRRHMRLVDDYRMEG